jgi:membrane associated rhomboid family serine protease
VEEDARVALPLYDSQPTRRAPLVTYFLIAANVVIFMITPMAGIADWYGQGHERECAQVTFILEHGAIPKELTSNRQDPIPRSVVVACHPQPHRKTPWLSAFSSMFLHSGWVHLLGNMVYLFVFGQATEDRLGRWRFLLFYLGCGVIAAYGFALSYPDSAVPLIGASGAIAGVLGSHLVMYPRSRTIALVLSVLPFRLPAWVVLGQFFIFQWVNLRAADQSGVAYVAHIYGFLAGVAIGLWARRSRAVRRVAAQGGWQ